MAQGRCEKCANLNEYSDTVCDFCGARLPWADAIRSASAAPENVAATTNAFYAPVAAPQQMSQVSHLPPPLPPPTAPLHSFSTPSLPTPSRPAPVGCLPLLGASLLTLIAYVLLVEMFGGAFGLLLWLGTTMWVGVDASNIGVKRGQLRGLGDSSVAAWVVGCALLWCVVFPAYLMARPELRRINGK